MAVMPFFPDVARSDTFTLQMIDDAVEKAKQWHTSRIPLQSHKSTIQALAQMQLDMQTAQAQQQAFYQGTNWMVSPPAQTTPGMMTGIGAPTMPTGQSSSGSPIGSLPSSPSGTPPPGVSSNGPGDAWGRFIQGGLWDNPYDPRLRIGPGPSGNPQLSIQRRDIFGKLIPQTGQGEVPDRPAPRFTWEEDK